MLAFRAVLAERPRPERDAWEAAVVLYVLALIAIVVGVDGPVFQEPVLGAVDGERRNSSGVLNVVVEVPAASINAARSAVGS
jgi:hypothetical protein